MHSATGHFVPAMAILNFGGRRTVSTSVQNFARTMLKKHGFGFSIPHAVRLIGRPPIQRKHIACLSLGRRTK